MTRTGEGHTLSEVLAEKIHELADQQAQQAAQTAPEAALPATPPEEPPSSAAILKLQVEIDLLREQLEQRRTENAILRDRSTFLREQQEHIKTYRRKYSSRVFWLTVLWLVFAAAVTVFSGMHTAFFSLSDTVLIALTGSAIASVIGMFLVILNWLYPREKEA